MLKLYPRYNSHLRKCKNMKFDKKKNAQNRKLLYAQIEMIFLCNYEFLNYYF